MRPNHRVGRRPVRRSAVRAGPVETEPRRQDERGYDRPPAMNIDGACLCGYIRYEATINPARVTICHCTQCQVGSASAFRFGVLVRKEKFRLLSGVPKVYVKTAESGNPRALAFCPECGTALYGTGVDDQDVLSLRLGTARQRAELAPQTQVWYRSALPWLTQLDGVRKIQLQTDPQPSTRSGPPGSD